MEQSRPCQEERPKWDSKIVMQTKPILEQLYNLFKYAVGIQIRITIYGGIATLRWSGFMRQPEG